MIDYRTLTASGRRATISCESFSGRLGRNDHDDHDDKEQRDMLEDTNNGPGSVQQRDDGASTSDS